MREVKFQTPNYPLTADDFASALGYLGFDTRVQHLQNGDTLLIIREKGIIHPAADAHAEEIGA